MNRLRLGACSAAALALVACGPSPMDPRRQIGANPALPPIHQYLMPPMHVAKVVAWGNATPTVAAGLQVKALATGLANPRSVYVLPNGDILVVETGGPPAPVNRPKEIVMNWVEKMAHSKNKPGQRILLFRDANGDGTPELKSVFLDHLNSPFGVVLVGNDLYVANTDAVIRYPYVTGQTRISAPGVRLCDLPGGPIDHHWTKSLTASPDGTKLYAGVGSNSNITENGLPAELGRAAVWEIDRATGAPRGAAQPERSAVRAPEPCAMGRGQRTRRTRSRPRARLSHFGEGWRLLRLALQLLRPACRSPGPAPAAGPGGQGDPAGLRP